MDRWIFVFMADWFIVVVLIGFEAYMVCVAIWPPTSLPMYRLWDTPRLALPGAAHHSV